MQYHRRFLSFSCGAVIGTLGGLIGLGGAEFRLPLLIGLFGFGALEAIILNKAMSLIVVAAAFPFRAYSVPFHAVFERWDIILTLLSGSLAGAWFGAGWATRLKSKTLYRVISGLLVAIAILLLFGHEANARMIHMNAIALAIIGSMTGVVIGVVASLMGVAGGELLIPTIILLFGANIKLAGSLSLVVSLPTMIAGFSRYSHDQSFSVIRQQGKFLILMAVGSLAGAFLGSQLLGVLPSHYLLPVLACILVISSVKVWHHAQEK